MNIKEARKATNQFVKDANDILQRMREHDHLFRTFSVGDLMEVAGYEVAIPQFTLATRDIESCVGRLKIVRRYLRKSP